MTEDITTLIEKIDALTSTLINNGSHTETELPDILVLLNDTKQKSKVSKIIRDIEEDSIKVEIQQPKKKRGRPPKKKVEESNHMTGNVVQNIKIVEPKGKMKDFIDWLLELDGVSGKSYLNHILSNSGVVTIKELSNKTGISVSGVYNHIKSIRKYEGYIISELRKSSKTVGDVEVKNGKIVLK